MSAKLPSSIPPENDTGRRSPKTRRKRATSAMARGCSGGPERYISGSLAGKKPLLFSTTKVLENFTPRPRPRAEA